MNKAVSIEPSTQSGDVCTREFSKFLSKEEIKNFSQINSWKFLKAVLKELVTIAFFIWLSEHYRNPPVYLLAVIIIGSRLHALAILMHEAAHYRASRNRLFNDIMGEMLAFPLTITMQGYRNSHFAHHRELNNENDPDWVRKLGAIEFSFPKTPRALLIQIIQFALGLKTYAMIKKTHGSKSVKPVSPRLRAFRTIAFLIIISTAIAFGFWQQLLLYWVVPLLTTFMLFEHIRSVAEHFGVEYEHVLNHTRSVVAPFWERWLFAPYGINYHLEHHLYPSVPFFRLPELHQFLMTKEEYVRAAHITKGYSSGLFQECVAGRRKYA